MLQWRLRHTAHPTEAEAANVTLSQLDPNFKQLSVEVPQQARLMMMQAMLQWTQRHAGLQLDAGHATRLQIVLEQIAPRFDGMQLALPLDEHSTTNTARDLLTEALKGRIENKSKKDLNQEDGMMLQHVLQQLAPAYALIPLDGLFPQHISEEDPDAPQATLDAEIERLHLGVDGAIDDEDLFTPVPLLSHTEPPEVIEAGVGKGRGNSPSRGKSSAGSRGSAEKSASPPPSPPPEVLLPNVASTIRRRRPACLDPMGADASPPPSPPAPVPEDAPAPNEDAAAQEIADMKKKKHLRFGRRKRREGDPMPCWKQYTMLFLGTCMVGVCNVAAISWMATMQPLQANIVLISWAIGWPCSFLFHQLTRAITRHFRKKRALRRGKKVKAMTPTLEAFKHKSAAGGLIASWDGMGKEEVKRPKKKSRLASGLGGLTKRGSGTPRSSGRGTTSGREASKKSSISERSHCTEPSASMSMKSEDSRNATVLAQSGRDSAGATRKSSPRDPDPVRV